MPVIDLSIILPVHNAETQIEQCLESILSSGYPVNTDIDKITYRYTKQQDSSLSGIRYNESQPGWFAQIVEDHMKRRAIEIISLSPLSIENSLKADNLFVNRKAKKAREGSTPKELIELCPQYIKACKNLVDYNRVIG